MLPNLGPMEMIVVMGVAVLLFGKRLPEVGRSLGKGIIEFKKGLRGIEDEFDLSATTSPQVPSRRYEEYSAPKSTDSASLSVPKFEPPTTAPIARGEHEASTPTD
ncbi:twin-arginine translocase TatA/TatE family subunit [Singulisphaera sp. PoT]|uniref:twin-arginine translocase TatA/TatE family subunit n=1 Tax=Singulisphaera sp. PoT TaxID=3411797 RepID=UPI003BF55B25